MIFQVKQRKTAAFPAGCKLTKLPVKNDYMLQKYTWFDWQKFSKVRLSSLNGPLFNVIFLVIFNFFFKCLLSNFSFDVATCAFQFFLIATIANFISVFLCTYTNAFICFR